MPFYLEGVAGIPSLNIADGMHPNAEGARIVERTIWSALEPLLEKRTAGGNEPWAMIELRGVSKTVQSGDRSSHDPASAGLHDSVRAVRRDRRTVRQRQVHAARSARRARCADDREILIDGVDITTLTEDGLARLRGEKIGFVFQFFHLVPSLTAFENMLIPMEIAGATRCERARAAAAREVGLSDRAHHYPSQLSGGEQQRIAIARALANDPPIVLADEPTGNLDSTTGRHIMDLLLNVTAHAQTTLVLVTHDAELASLADRRLVLRDGRPVPQSEAPARIGPVAAESGAMSFVIRMALREIRASWQRLLVLLRLHRRRRGVDRRHSIGDSERACRG